MSGNDTHRMGARPVRGEGGVEEGGRVGLGGDGEGIIEMRMDRTVVAAKESLGEAGFQSAWEAGQRMTIEEAVELAMKEL